MTRAQRRRKEETVAVVEIKFRGRWIPIYEVSTYASESGFNYTCSEPVKEIRVTYVRR